MVPTVEIRRHGWVAAIPVLLGLLGIIWTVRHVWLMSAVYSGQELHRMSFETSWALSFVFLAAQVFLAWREPIYEVTRTQQLALDTMTVTVNVPVYNEDPECLARGLHSILAQTRLPNRVQVVDDGSETDYDAVKARFLPAARALGIHASWVRQENAGKRHAQVVTFRHDTADIYITLDSDTLLDRNAIEEGLKPFANPRITSVAGLYLGLNATKSWLTRLAELVCVSWQLQGRSATSTMGNVLVNSGAFALYRGWIFRKYVDAYLGETFFGRRVPFSDDAHMTMFCLMHGRTVQQRTAASLTLYPESASQYCRQYTRWMRGAFIRMWWRFRYLPLRSFALWNELLGRSEFLMAFVIFGALYVYWPLIDHSMWPFALLIPLLLGFVVTSRYLLVKREDVSTGSMLLTYSMAPVMILWCWFVCRPITVYAAFTCLKTGWGTRVKGVEVGLDGNGQPEPAPISTFTDLNEPTIIIHAPSRVAFASAQSPAGGRHRRHSARRVEQTP
jgi:hyaluronan synthase